MTNSEPKPPKHLSRGAKALWRRVASESDLDAPAIVLLDTLAEQWDRMQAARELIRKQGIVVKQKTAAGNVRLQANPAVQVEHAAAQSLMRCWRLLGYDQQPPPGVR